MRQTLRKAVQTAANKLRGDTKRIFKSSLPTARNRNPKYNDTLVDAVRKSKVEETSRGEISSKVHIMGTRATGSGTYRARFFEKGTAQRHTRKGYNRGSLKALYFFQSANTTFQSDYDKILNDAIAKAIAKINAKKNNKQ